MLKINKKCKKIQRLVRRFPDYVTYQGFYDLRCFDMPITIFKKLWKIQAFLFNISKNKKYYKKWHLNQWEEAKELSAKYQNILFQYEERWE